MRAKADLQSLFCAPYGQMDHTGLPAVTPSEEGSIISPVWQRRKKLSHLARKWGAATGIQLVSFQPTFFTQIHVSCKSEEILLSVGSGIYNSQHTKKCFCFLDSCN